MHTIEILDPRSMKNWDELVLATGSYSFFHSSFWAKVLAETYNYRPLYFTIRNNGKITGLLPVMEVKSKLTGHRGISLPFSDGCNPIALEKNDFDQLFDRLLEYGKQSNWRYVELRGGENFLSAMPPAILHYNHTLNLSQSEENIFCTFRSSTKRNIKKAVKKGVTVNMSNSYDAIKSFYRLNCLTRKEHGLPPQPFRFFISLYKSIISKGLGLVALAAYDQQTISGAIYFHFGDKAMYKYGASDRKYQHLRSNNLVMWEAIKYYISHKMRQLDMGRTATENKGLEQYKNGWGTRKRLIAYYRYDFKSHKFIKDNEELKHISQKLFGNCPIFFLKLISHFGYRHAA